jgi:hypothetical protein
MLVVELATLRDVLSDVADRLREIEVHADERARAGSRVLEITTATAAVVDDRRGQVLPLQQLRKDRGWSQMKLIHRLRATAAEQGITLPVQGSLKTMVCRWEHGRAVSEFYRDLLMQVFAPVEAVAA